MGDAFTCQGGKRLDQPSFSSPDNHLHKVDALSCQGGERMGQPSFSQTLKSQGCMHINDRVRLMSSLVRVGKEWTSQVFLHPNNHLHKVDALSCQGGERMGRPSFSPSTKKAKFVCIFITG